MKNIVFFTGSGISKESGIQTFRDAGEGLWENFSIEEVCTHEAIMQNRKKYSILMLNGITTFQLALLIMTETLLIFVFAAVLFFILKYVLRNVPTLDFGLNRYSVICISVIEVILLVLIGFYGIRKVRQVDMSTVLREHE